MQRELLIRNLYHVQPSSHLLVHIDNRLANRETVVDWNGNLMGPILDEQGLEQGGSNSSDYYKIYGKEILTLPQQSLLGLKIGPLNVSCIGQADDTLLLATDISSLFYQLELVKSSCKKNRIDLSAEKTILQLYSKMKPDENDFNHLNINGKSIPFSSQASHVGIVRSIHGNEPAILDRITAHRKALAAVMFTGLAKGHRANPMISIRVEKIYATPVLLSGIASLVLTKKDIEMIDHHYQETLRRLLRLHRNTPRSFIYFLAGCLPGAALVHMRQLSLFSMICRLDSSNILYQHSKNVLSSVVHFRGSWLHQIREWCLMYQLPHPSHLFERPLTKSTFKITVKKQVINYWENVLRKEAFQLKSLSLFRPEYMSLCTPHLLWKTAGFNPTKVAMATVQALFLSGRYRCGSLTRHWALSSNDGSCQLAFECQGIIEDVSHILHCCPGLRNVRLGLYDYTTIYSSTLPVPLMQLLRAKCSPDNPSFVAFLLDCSTDPDAIFLAKNIGHEVFDHLFDVTRTWAYVIHRERLKMLGRWRPVRN